MLFTRCPDCDTTFRVTDDALKKANGQVRCGRCASVFNAYAERRDGPVEPAMTPPPPEPAAPVPAAQPTTSAAPPAPAAPAPKPAASAARPAPAPPASKPAASSTPPAPAAPASKTATSSAAAAVADAAHSPSVEQARPSESAGPREAARATIEPAPASPAAASHVAPPGAASAGPLSVAEVVAQVALGVAAEDADTGEMEAHVPPEGDGAISASQVERVLETHEAETQWLLGEEAPRRRGAWWNVAVLGALVALGLQAVHHYRAELVSHAFVGPLIQHAYALLGVDVLPRWDIHQYEILDWVASAEPNTRGQGSLTITARIKNRGPQYQPYPSVHLRLKDRWEAAVGSRIFAPQEYLPAAPRKLMAPGETARAQIEVVDPGSDAYGFELDVCIEIETHVLSCGSDKVFL